MSADEFLPNIKQKLKDIWKDETLTEGQKLQRFLDFADSYRTYINAKSTYEREKDNMQILLGLMA